MHSTSGPLILRIVRSYLRPGFGGGLDINKQGGTFNPPTSSEEGFAPVASGSQYHLPSQARHITGRFNMVTDCLSRSQQALHMEWRLILMWAVPCMVSVNTWEGTGANQKHSSMGVNFVCLTPMVLGSICTSIRRFWIRGQVRLLPLWLSQAFIWDKLRWGTWIIFYRPPVTSVYCWPSYPMGTRAPLPSS